MKADDKLTEALRKRDQQCREPEKDYAEVVRKTNIKLAKASAKAIRQRELRDGMTEALQSSVIKLNKDMGKVLLRLNGIDEKLESQDLRQLSDQELAQRFDEATREIEDCLTKGTARSPGEEEADG